MGCEVFGDTLAEHIQHFVGETVTIFTESGGLTGCGFTGVVLSVNNCFVRLITRIGRAPECPLGNTFRGGFNGSCNLGSVTDIPLDRIVSFVHNAV